MAIFGGRAQAQSGPGAAELSRVVPSSGDDLRDEAALMAAASDDVLRRRFAMVWPRDFALPANGDRRVEAVQEAIVFQEREELADLDRRAGRIAGMPDEERNRAFGVTSLPGEPVARVQASIDLAMLEVEGFESPRIAAERALEKARAVREALSLDRGDADRFKDVSPLARLTWKHVPDMAARFGVPIDRQEGYAPSDAEHGDTGLAIHNSGADSRAASRVRNGFSQAVNAGLDVLVGPNGSGGMVDRMVEAVADRERRLAHRPGTERSKARDMSAAAFLSGISR